MPFHTCEGFKSVVAVSGPLQNLRVVAVEHGDLLDRLVAVCRSPFVGAHLAAQVFRYLLRACHVARIREDLLVQDVARDGLLENGAQPVPRPLAMPGAAELNSQEVQAELDLLLRPVVEHLAGLEVRGVVRMADERPELARFDALLRLGLGLGSGLGFMHACTHTYMG